MKTKAMRWGYRLLFYILGQAIITAGIVLAVKANIGVSAGSSLPTVVSTLTGFSLGTCIFVFFCCLIVVQIVVFKKEFPIRNLLQVFASLLFGVLTDFWVGLFSGIVPTTYLHRIALLLASVVLQSFGIAIYIDTNIVPMPAEGFMLAIKKLFPKFSIGTAKIVEDCFIVLVAFVVCVVVTFIQGDVRVIGIREGTVILALCIGKVMGFFHKPLSKPLDKLFFGDNAKTVKK